MRIGFVTDTNMLKKANIYENEKILDNADIYIDYINSLKNATNKAQLTYFMPNIVVEELREQKKEAFNELYESFKKNYNKLLYGLSGELPTPNIDNFLNNEINDYATKYKIISLPYTAELFKELVDESIRKIAPFSKVKQGKKSDSGFKDALIWKTILYANEISNCDIFYLISCDCIFKDNELELIEKFKKYHPNTELRILYFEPNREHRQLSLQKLIADNNLIESTIIKLYNKELILKDITGIAYEPKNNISYLRNEEEIILSKIVLSNFEKKDFIIENVNEIGENYEVIINFNTLKYEVNSNNFELERPLLGTIRLYYKLNNKKFSLNNFKFENIRFYVSPFEELLMSIGKSTKKIYNDEMTDVMNNFNQTFQNYQIKNSPFSELITNINNPLNELKKSLFTLSINDNIKNISSLGDKITNVQEPIKKIHENKKMKDIISPLKDVKEINNFKPIGTALNNLDKK